MWKWPFRDRKFQSKQPQGWLFVISLVLGLMSVSFPVYAIDQQSTSETNDNAPIPLIPPQITEEENLNQITLPPPAAKENNGVDEATIFHYFDSSSSLNAESMQLPKNTKQTLDAISNHWAAQQQQKAPISIKRGTFPDLSIDATEKSATTQTDKPKLNISISNGKVASGENISELQEKAYNALMVGQVEVAISLYKQSLKLSPNNRLSMFGLATTYHRNGQLTQARNLYSDILMKYPDDRDTLNNFLVLISESAPQDALSELQRLEYQNPGFSPVIAQIGMLYQRMGNNAKAIEYLKRAISLSPENISYRYNLAVLFDRIGNYQEAARFYRQVLEAAGTGQPIPGDKQDIYNRLLYISTEH